MESDVKDKFLLISEITLGLHAKGAFDHFEYRM